MLRPHPATNVHAVFRCFRNLRFFHSGRHDAGAASFVIYAKIHLALLPAGLSFGP